MESEELPLYCICRSPDIERFMIMCDKCEEWYHGDCINITEKESRKIKYFYCKWCRRKNPSLKTQYRKSKRTHEKEAKKAKKAKRSKEEIPQEIKKKRSSEYETSKVKREKSEDSIKPTAAFENPVKVEATKLTENKDKSSSRKGDVADVRKENGSEYVRCGRCKSCARGERCLRFESCFDPEKATTVHSRNQPTVKPEPVYPPKIKIKKEYPDYDLADDFSDMRNIDISQILSQRVKEPDSRRKSHGKQCYGPGCTLVARQKSKYCSDECGKRLAAKRLSMIMPSRVDAWHSTPTVANEIGSAELERIRSAMTQARSELEALEAKFRRLESIISRSKTFPLSEGSTDADDNDEGDHNIFCVVCGHPVALKSAIKHMDRCYIKIEAQISFGSVYPTRIEGSERLFCDVYNRQQQTYCKRLQVICPEHAKEPKIGPNEICGCPVRNDIYDGEEPSKASDFCTKAKRKCNKHFKWESMYRASVDLQRIRQWLKIDEIFEEERRIRSAMVARAGVIPLLLHQTTAHDSQCLDMRTKPSNLKKPAYRLVI